MQLEFIHTWLGWLQDLLLYFINLKSRADLILWRAIVLVIVIQINLLALIWSRLLVNRKLILRMCTRMTDLTDLRE